MGGKFLEMQSLSFSLPSYPFDSNLSVCSGKQLGSSWKSYIGKKKLFLIKFLSSTGLFTKGWLWTAPLPFKSALSLIPVFQKNPSVWMGAGVKPSGYKAESSSLESVEPTDELKKV